jgi:hypothetical protein
MLQLKRFYDFLLFQGSSFGGAYCIEQTVLEYGDKIILIERSILLSGPTA